MDVARLIGKASLFLCNTNRREGLRHEGDSTFFERLMYEKRFAMAWTSFKHPNRMLEVERGDLIVMWAKKVGAIGLGRAQSGVKIISSAGNRFYTGFDKPRFTEDEWRIPVEWLSWVDERQAYPWHGEGMNFTFARVDNDTWIDQSKAGIRHLLRSA